MRGAPPVDASGYRNGYGKPRKLTTPMGTIEVRRPRLRGVEERFESRILPLFVRRTREVSDLLPELYLHGLAEGDFDLAPCGLPDPARSFRRGGASFGFHRGAPEGEVAGGVGGVAQAAPERAGGSLSVGGRHLCQGGAGEGAGGAAGGHRRLVGWPQGGGGGGSAPIGSRRRVGLRSCGICATGGCGPLAW